MVGRSVIDRSRVISLRHAGKRPADIVRETGFDRKFVYRWVSVADSTNDPTDKARSGRPRKLTAPAVAKVRAMLKGKKGRSLRKVAKLYEERKHVKISYSTVRVAALETGLKPYHRKKSLCSANGIAGGASNLLTSTETPIGVTSCSRTKRPSSCLALRT
jgi:transposase